MKAKLIRDDLEFGPTAEKVYGENFVAENSVVTNGIRYVKPGMVIDHPDAFRLVQNGVAIPADAECEQRAGNLTAEQLDEKQQAYEETNEGLLGDENDGVDFGKLSTIDDEEDDE